MTQDDVLFGYRLSCLISREGSAFRLPAGRSGFIARPTTPGSGRSTGTGWRCCARGSGGGRGCRTSSPRSSRSGSSRSRSRHPGLGPRRVASELARPRWGGIIVSAQRRLALSTPTRAQHARQAAVAGRRLPRALRAAARAAARAAHRGRAARRAGRHRLLLRRTATRHRRRDLAADRDRRATPRSPGPSWSVCQARQSDRAADLDARPPRRARAQSRRLAARARPLRQRQRVPRRALPRHSRASRRPHTHIRAGRPQTNGHVEALHKTILDECWRPAFARYLYPRYSALSRELDRYLLYYNNDRAHHGRITRGRIPADIVYGAHKMETR